MAEAVSQCCGLMFRVKRRRAVPSGTDGERMAHTSKTSRLNASGYARHARVVAQNDRLDLKSAGRMSSLSFSPTSIRLVSP